MSEGPVGSSRQVCQLSRVNVERVGSREACFLCDLPTRHRRQESHIPLRNFKSVEEKNERIGRRWPYHQLELHKPAGS